MLTAPVITPRELAETLESVRILDCRSGPEAASTYVQGHVHGALRVDLECDLSFPTENPAEGGRHPLPSIAAWTAKLGAWGIRPDTDVVVYDDKGGANAAARCWWMLRAVGHDRVAVLDGGFDAAVEAGLPIDTAPPQIEPVAAYPADDWRLPLADVEAVSQHRSEPDWLLLDVREAPRYAGESEPIDPVAGHIPGAVNLHFGENLDADGRLLPPETLAEKYRALLGDVRPERVIVHCGSGVTACHTLLALERAGLPGAVLYVGSWSEWCRQDRPREPRV